MLEKDGKFTVASVAKYSVFETKQTKKTEDAISKPTKDRAFTHPYRAIRHAS